MGQERICGNFQFHEYANSTDCISINAILELVIFHHRSKSDTTTSVWVGILFAIGGIIVAAKASQVISVSTVADMRTDRKPELITGGLYSQIRHPLYLATILIFGAMALIYPFPVVIMFALSMIVYTIIGAYFEERKLVLQYGDEYNEYKKQAGFILPWF